MTSFMRSLKNVQETPGDISKTINVFMVFLNMVRKPLQDNLGLGKEDKLTALQL